MHCAESLSGYHGKLAAFFLAGLVGGFTHCLAMCGPFVACERACASGCGTREGMGLPYHLGRLTTYSALGFVVALFSQQVAAASWWPVLSSLLLALAGLLFLLSCLKPCHAAHVNRSGLLSYLRGVLLGFMPCGLLYAALMMAATLIDPIRGAVAMALFTFGTMPALWLVSGGTHILNRKWRLAIPRIGRALMAFNGLSLLVMAATHMR